MREEYFTFIVSNFASEIKSCAYILPTMEVFSTEYLLNNDKGNVLKNI